MHTTAFTAVLAAALVAVTGPHPQAAHTDHADIDAYFEDRFAATGVPGAAYAVVTPDGIEHLGTWGEDGDGAAVTETTPFLWGSVAKPVTATAVMTLVEDGAIDLDDPVNAHLEDFTLADADHADRVTVRHLLQQTSGIPEGTGVTDRFDDRADPYAEPVADLADVEPFAPPGERFEYASANYLVLGALVEAVTGQPYDEYLREAVLDPLGMDGAIATADEAAALPDGHTKALGQSVAIDARFDPTGPSYGYLGGDVEDLAHFAMAQLAEGSYDGTEVLTPDSIRQTHTGAAEISDTVDYGLGWRVGSHNDDLGTATVWHTGAAPGYIAGIVLLPDLDRAVVVLQNLYGFFQDGELVGTVLGAARIAAGGDAPESGADPLYGALLAVLAVLVIAAVAVTAVTIRRIRSGAARTAPRWKVITGMVCWTAGAAALVYPAVTVPLAASPSPILVFLLAPDLAVGLAAVVLGAVAVASSRLFWGAKRLRRA